MFERIPNSKNRLASTAAIRTIGRPDPMTVLEDELKNLTRNHKADVTTCCKIIRQRILPSPLPLQRSDGGNDSFADSQKLVELLRESQAKLLKEPPFSSLHPFKIPILRESPATKLARIALVLAEGLRLHGNTELSLKAVQIALGAARLPIERSIHAAALLQHAELLFGEYDFAKASPAFTAFTRAFELLRWYDRPLQHRALGLSQEVVRHLLQNGSYESALKWIGKFDQAQQTLVWQADDRVETRLAWTMSKLQVRSWEDQNQRHSKLQAFPDMAESALDLFNKRAHNRLLANHVLEIARLSLPLHEAARECARQGLQKIIARYSAPSEARSPEVPHHKALTLHAFDLLIDSWTRSGNSERAQIARESRQHYVQNTETGRIFDK